MPKPQVIFWEVGKELSKNKWERGEFVKSPKFSITDTCSLETYFYPEGLEDNERPLFKRVRNNTDQWMNIKGFIQLCHGITIVKEYILDEVFKKGEDCATYGLEDIPKLATFRIFHSLPDLCYRLVFTVSTDEEAYAKCSPVPQNESSEPEEDSVQQTLSSEPEADSVQQTQSSVLEADSVQQTQSSVPEADSVQQTQSSVPEADSVQQTQSLVPEADSVKQIQSSVPEVDSAEQTQSSKPVCT